MKTQPESDLASIGVDGAFMQLADTAPVMIWVAGRDQQLSWFNQYRSTFTGVPVEDEIGLGWLDQVHPDDRDLCVATLKAAFKTQRPMRMEYRLRSRSGDYHWIFAHGVPNFDADGEFFGFVGCCTDVQELKAAQSQLQREHEFLERLIDVGDRESEAVASCLHDRVLQPLLAAKMHIQSLDKSESVTDRTTKNVDLASKLLSDVADECLQIINRTRPLIIDEQGVQVAVQDLLAALNEQGSTKFRFVQTGELGRLPRLWEGSLYWIVSEATQNVVRHANARNATVALTSDDRVVTIEVKDDGAGFDGNRVDHEAFGLTAMEERALLFGGRFFVKTSPGEGTTLSVLIPLPHELDA